MSYNPNYMNQLMAFICDDSKTEASILLSDLGTIQYYGTFLKVKQYSTREHRPMYCIYGGPNLPASGSLPERLYQIGVWDITKQQVFFRAEAHKTVSPYDFFPVDVMDSVIFPLPSENTALEEALNSAEETIRQKIASEAEAVIADIEVSQHDVLRFVITDGLGCPQGSKYQGQTFKSSFQEYAKRIIHTTPVYDLYLEPKAVADEIASKYLANNRLNAIRSLATEMAFWEAVDAMTNNMPEAIAQALDIFYAIPENIENVTVSIIAYGKLLTFALPANELKSGSTNYDLSGSKHYQKVSCILGRSSISVTEIERITYGRKILYQRGAKA